MLYVSAVHAQMWDRGLQENLSHAGKIRLLQMTAYHALLLNTSFPQLALVTIARNEKERFTNLVCRCRQGRVEGPDLMRDWSFIHCVSRTAGNGITSTRQRGQSWSQSKHAHKQKLSGLLSPGVSAYRSSSIHSRTISFSSGCLLRLQYLIVNDMRCIDLTP